MSGMPPPGLRIYNMRILSCVLIPSGDAILPSCNILRIANSMTILDIINHDTSEHDIYGTTNDQTGKYFEVRDDEYASFYLTLDDNTDGAVEV